MIGADNWLWGSEIPKFTKYWWENLFKVLKRYPVHKYQRLTRGFSDVDMWNAESYLADVISAAAYWHFVHNKGYPARMTQEEWLDILLEIRDGFSTRDECGFPTIPDRAWGLLKENFMDLWD